MEYTAVIRTLGKAGDKYQRLLDSLVVQTILPKEIIVYIAEGYELPKETIGIERYVYVKKGMMAQRALPYTEVGTEYMLCLDDDLELASNTVERMHYLLIENGADVISPDIFPNAERSLGSELMMTLSGRMRARRGDNRWGYKVMRTAGYSYNKSPNGEVLESQSNAGACFLCRKHDFNKIALQQELWIDKIPYALGEDQIMYYKMFWSGMKILTWYNHDIVHLDAGDNRSPKRVQTLIYCDFWFKTIFWHRFIYLPETSLLKKMWSVICIGYVYVFTLGISLLKGQWNIFKLKKSAISEAKKFLRSEEYQSLPLIKVL